VKARIPGDAGGLAAAVMTGDRSGLSQRATQSLRDLGLYYLLSISGMHMGLLVAFALTLVRTGIALVPPLALRVPGKKVAALAAFPVAAFYLALAGRDVATERAFVMVAVMLGAVRLDRRAVTLRSVGIAALIVLALRPESLVNPGFQMSFAAVAALATMLGMPLSARMGR
jgi:competence protein ComEC